MNCMSASNKSETFVVRVDKDTNGCWSGNVLCVGKRIQRSFSSMQELLLLMNSANITTEDE